MSPSEPRRSRTGSALSRVLLLAVLLLGFGSMHTLGHVQHEAHASTASPGSAGSRMLEPTPAPHTVPTPGAGAHSAPLESAGSGSGPHSASSQSTPPLPELDPTSVCLTLGTFAVVLLGVAPGAFLRWPSAPADSAAPVLFPARPPFPAPDEPSLSRLQVLRI